VNKLFVAIAAVFVIAGNAAAIDSPAVLTFETKNGKVTFHHREHQERLKGECKTCHGDAAPGKIAGWSKDKAHGTCKECHAKGGKGPTKCADCHKKA
jgi:hypothetical protein